jgi:hypothetical protein
MDTPLLRLFVPVFAGVLLGLVSAARGFLRAKGDAPEGAGPLGLVPCAVLVLVPTTKLFFAAILAFAVKAPDAPRFDPATVYFVAGNVMGLVAFAQGLVAAARMPAVLSAAANAPRDALPPRRRGSAPATPFSTAVLLLAVLEAPASFALAGAIVALGLRA